MRRKFLLTSLVVMVMAASAIWATPWVQVGAVVDYGKSVTDDGFAEGFKEFSNYGFGAEARFNLFEWVGIDVPATFRFGEGFTASTRPSLNLNIPVLDALDVAFGLGTMLDISNSSGDWTMNGSPLSQSLEVLKGSSLFYRGAVTLNLTMLSVGIAAEVPITGTFSSFDMTPSWESTRLSASMLFNLL